MDVGFCGDDNGEKIEAKNVSKSVIINHYGTEGRPMIADRWAMIERISDTRVAKVSIHYVSIFSGFALWCFLLSRSPCELYLRRMFSCFNRSACQSVAVHHTLCRYLIEEP